MTGALTCICCFCVLDTRNWLTVCLTVVYDCRCGFSSGTAVGFQRHIARYKGEFFENMYLVGPCIWLSRPATAYTGETGKHRMVKRPSAPTTSSAETADTLAVEPSRPSERSWLSTLWASGLQCPSCFQSKCEAKGLQILNLTLNLLIVDTDPQKPSATSASSTTALLEQNRCL